MKTKDLATALLNVSVKQLSDSQFLRDRQLLRQAANKLLRQATAIREAEDALGLIKRWPGVPATIAKLKRLQ